MAANEYEPSAEAVEALAKELYAEYRSVYRACSRWGDIVGECKDGYRAEARFILRRQHARESRLLEALKRLRTFYDVSGYGYSVARDALAAHAKLDAPKVPTLLEAAKAMLDAGAHAYALTSARDALKAAVEREEREKR